MFDFQCYLGWFSFVELAMFATIYSLTSSLIISTCVFDCFEIWASKRFTNGLTENITCSTTSRNFDVPHWKSCIKKIRAHYSRDTFDGCGCDTQSAQRLSVCTLHNEGSVRALFLLPRGCQQFQTAFRCCSVNPNLIEALRSLLLNLTTSGLLLTNAQVAQHRQRVKYAARLLFRIVLNNAMSGRLIQYLRVKIQYGLLKRLQ